MASRLLAFEPVYVRVRSSGMRSDLLLGCCWGRRLCDPGKRMHSSAPGSTDVELSASGSASVEDNACGSSSDSHSVSHALQEESHSPTVTRRQPPEKSPVGPENTITKMNNEDVHESDGVLNSCQHGVGVASARSQAEAVASGKDLVPYYLQPSYVEWRNFTNELRKSIDLKNYRMPDHVGKVYLDGVYYDSASDPTFIRLRNENFIRGVEAMQEKLNPDGELPIDILCRLRGRKPYYERSDQEDE